MREKGSDATQGGRHAGQSPRTRIEPDVRPTALVVASAGQGQTLARWTEQAGMRCVGTIAPGAVRERLARTVMLDLILVDLRGADVELDREASEMLDARDGLADTPLAVLTDLPGLEAAMRVLRRADIEFLCEPTQSDIVSLLVLAALKRTPAPSQMLHDPAREDESARLERLSEEVRRLAETIDRMGQVGGAGASKPETLRDRQQAYRVGYGSSMHDSADLLQLRSTGDGGEAAVPTPQEFRAIIRARRLREQFLPAELFADPAWDMILDLMAARLARQRVSVSSLCIAAAVPPTTALRWIRHLTDREVFARLDDPADGRRVFIELTDTGAQAVLAWTEAVRRQGGLLPPSSH